MNSMIMNGFDLYDSLPSLEVKSFDSVTAKKEVDFEAGLEALHMELQGLMDKLANALIEIPALDAKAEQDKKSIQQLIHRVRVLSQFYLNL